MKITASVGDHSRSKKVPNKYDDVIVVQKLLNNAATKTGNMAFQASVPPDGRIHSTASKCSTVKAINRFQELYLKFSSTDGIVEPGGKTLAALEKLGAAVAELRSTNHWDWPLDLNQIRRGLVNHTFGMVRDNGKKPHQGWDFYALPGTACYAIADGVVHQVRNGGNKTDYGNQVVLKHRLKGKVIYSQYAHLQGSSVNVGNTVRMGQEIAKTGNTGNAESMRGLDQHLHFEIRTAAKVGLGLAGRQSPKNVFAICPMKLAQVRKYKPREAHVLCYIDPHGPKITRGLGAFGGAEFQDL